MPIDDDRASETSRLVAIRTAQLTLRLMENWRRHVKDYDSVMVLLAVVAITAEKLTRTGLERELQDLSRPLPPGKLGKCNISSVAAATGLNRETARRKINELLRDGFLVRSEGSLAYNPVLAQDPERIELVWTQLETVRKAANDLVRDGALRLRDQRSRGAEKQP